MPYIAMILDELAAGTEDIQAAFGSHIHWGFWSNPALAGGSPEEYGVAAEHMSKRVCAEADIADGMRVLDCGCGLGGTIASLNQEFDNVALVGLNIDERQLELARAEVTARSGNSVGFVEGDACALPFADGSFDVVLAVECIFHFPSRLRFLREARRVLRPGGRLAFSDLLVRPTTPRAMGMLAELRNAPGTGYFGTVSSLAIPPTKWTYRALLAAARLQARSHDDITPNVMPSFPVQLARYERHGGETLVRLGRKMQTALQEHAMAYAVMSATKRSRHGDRRAARNTNARSRD